MKSIFTLLFVSFTAFSLYAQDYVKVLKIDENRSKDLLKSENKFRFTNYNNALKITLEFDKVGLVAATKYKFQINSAKDDSGKALKLKGMNAEKFKKLDRKFMYFGDKEKNPNKIKLELSLDTTERKAKTVSVDGVLLVKAGDQSAVFIKNAAAMNQQKFEHDVLKKAGVNIIVGAKSEFGNDSQEGISMEITGKLDAIAEVKLMDAKGKTVSNGSSSSTFNGKMFKKIYTKGKPGKDLMVKLMIITKEVERKLPFKLENVELP